MGTQFEVLEEAPTPAAGAPRSGGAPQPLRKVVATGSIGLMMALAGTVMPYRAAEYAFLPALAAAVILWQLLSSGMARTQATTKPLKPFGAILALAAGGVAFGLGNGDVTGVTGAILCIFGGALSLAAPSMGKKADSKLPPAPADAAVDEQFSKSLLAYLLITFGLSLAWTNDASATGLNTILGGLTFMFCLLGLWASWVGMWKMWAMSAFTTGSLGLVLFLAPLEAVFTGILGLARVFMGPSMEALGVMGAWPGDDAPGMMYAFGPLMVLVGGALATFELVQGAKKGLKSNQIKKDAEIASRKAARAVRRGDEPEKADAKDAKIKK